MGGLDKVPVKAVAAVVGAVLLLLIAFTAPFSGGESGQADAQAVSQAAVDPTLVGDGAALIPARSGVTSPAEGQPAVSIPQPAAGAQPVQTIVISVDGGCETENGTIRTFLDTAKQVNGRFTFFMSGLCLLPDSQRMRYQPPGHLAGQSDVGFATAELVDDRIRVFTEMWREGHEVGTHFLGHFCGSGGVDNWTAEQWRSEISQARDFLDNWPGNNPQVTDQSATLPFDSSVIVGDRTPCLRGAAAGHVRGVRGGGLPIRGVRPGRAAVAPQGRAEQAVAVPAAGAETHRHRQLGAVDGLQPAGQPDRRRDRRPRGGVRSRRGADLPDLHAGTRRGLRGQPGPVVPGDPPERLGVRRVHQVTGALHRGRPREVPRCDVRQQPGHGRLARRDGPGHGGGPAETPGPALLSRPRGGLDQPHHHEVLFDGLAHPERLGADDLEAVPPVERDGSPVELVGAQPDHVVVALAGGPDSNGDEFVGHPLALPVGVHVDPA